MKSGLRTVLLVLIVVGAVAWVFMAYVAFVAMPAVSAKDTALFAGGLHLQHALDEMPINLSANFQLANGDCEKTRWTSQELRQAFMAQAISADDLRASIQEVMRMTEKEGGEAHARRWASLRFWQ